METLASQMGISTINWAVVAIACPRELPRDRFLLNNSSITPLTIR
jgi:hypothetical protein